MSNHSGSYMLNSILARLERYPRVVQRLRQYASMLSDSLSGSRSVGEQLP